MIRWCTSSTARHERVRDTMVSERERREGEVAADADRAALQQQMLEDRLAAAASEVEQLQAQVAGLEQVIKATGVELTCCTSSLEAKAAEVCALTEKLEQQKEEKVSADMKGKLALEAITKECERETCANKTLESENKELMWKLEAQGDKAADLKAQLAAAHMQLEERRKDLDKRECEKEEARMEVARLKAEHDMQEIKLEETKAKLDDKEE